MTPRSAPRLVVYSRQDCQLCEQMLQDLAAWLSGRTFSAEVRDVDADPATRARYGLKVPLLAVDDQPVCSGQLDTDLLEELLYP